MDLELCFDFNLDGYPIYVGNDFMKTIIINNGDGTFKEKHFGHTINFQWEWMADIIMMVSRYSTLDMLPENEKILKASLGDDNAQMLKMRTEN
jgi:hypothetical protein